MNNSSSLSQSIRLLTLKQVKAITGLSATTIWRLQQRSDFPIRRQLGRNRVAWLESEVHEWIAKRPKAK